MAIEKRYWDSDAFLGFFKEEPDKVDLCEGVLEAAEDGRILLVTSALTLAEVLYVQKQPKLPISKRKEIDDFFKQPYISVQNVTRNIADMARDLVWDHNIRPKDAIHVATALSCKLKKMNTFDGELIKKSGLLGDPRLIIEKPHEKTQRKLDLD